jgi:DNA-binding FadR family transcriptional regulator
MKNSAVLIRRSLRSTLLRRWTRSIESPHGQLVGQWEVGVAADEVTSLLARQLAPVPSESIVFRVAQSLLDHLTSGAVAPGTRLPSERQLAETLNVGRSAVREALAALDLLGIVSIRPGSGTYMRDSTSEILPKAINWGLMLGQPRVHDLVEVRQFLEVSSAQLAAERADDADIERLSERLETMREATKDPARFAEADVGFHLEVARTAKNSVLSDVLNSVRALLSVWIQRTSVDQTGTELSLTEHEAIFAAIRSRDGAAAREAMQEHMAIASARLRRSLDGESPTGG